MTQIKVLIPLDGSLFAERALDLLPALGSLGDLYVRLIGAIDEQELESLPQAHDWLEKEERLLREHLELKKRDLEAADMLAGAEVHRGKPAKIILDAAERFKPDYVIISSHSRSGIQRWRLGSVADKVVRGAPCSVIVLGPSTVPARTLIRNIMVPLDGSTLAEAALPQGIELARSLEARLHLVRVATYPLFADDAGWAWDAVKSAAKAYLETAAQKVEAVEVVTALETGTPAAQLLEYAQKHHIDLIAMTSHGRGGFLRSALGSVTNALLGGRTPVLAIKAGVP